MQALLLMAVGLTLGAQDRPVGRGVNFYSQEKEAAVGAKLAEDVRRQVIAVESVAVREYVARLGRQLAEHIPGAGYDYTFTVFSSGVLRTVNPTHEPLSFMGGHVFVPASLILAARSDAELAGMLAHAMAHVAARHGSRMATRGQIVNMASIPLVFAGGWQFGGRESLVPLGFRKLMRTMELEADEIAAGTMARAGYDPAALMRYLDRTQVDSEKQEEDYSTLPARERRIAALDRAIGELGERAYSSNGEFPRIQDELRGLVERPMRPPTLRR